MLIQPSYADTVSIDDDTVLGLSDPATFTSPFESGTTFLLTVQIDLGAVHLDPDPDGGDAQFGSGLFVVPHGDPPPTVLSDAVASSRPMWFTRNLSGVPDTRRQTWALGAANFTREVSFDFGPNDLYLGIGSVFGNSLIGIAVPVYPPSGFVTAQSPDGWGGYVP